MNTTQISSGLSKKTYALFWVFLLTISTPFSTFAGFDHKRENNFHKAVTIENFGKVNDHFYRGAQPSREEYAELATLGIKTVIDLRDDAKPYAKLSAESNGLRYISFPMSDKKYPQAQTAQKFLEHANNQENWPIYVHCAGGRHRTGVMTAAYRITVDGWDMDRSYAEMKDYDFYTSWGHQAMKDYIFDFYKAFKLKDALAKQQSEATVKAPK